MHLFTHAFVLFFLCQTITNALWCITNHHTTINNTALSRKEVLPIPPAFQHFDGFDDRRRKKLKGVQLSSMELNSHCQVLYSLLQKPVINSSPSWRKAAQEIKQLADCLHCYHQYLEKQKEVQQKNQALPHPVRTIADDATIEHRQISPFGVREKYCLLDEAVRTAEENVPVVFDESVHLKSPFESNLERFKFVKELQLSVPVDMLRFCPGGSTVSTLCLIRVDENRLQSQLLTDGAQLVEKVRPQLKEYHTRAQRQLFKAKLNNVAKILPSVADLIYKELTLDASAAAHPDTQERLRLIFLGESDLLADLRHLNPGRPSHTFDKFFEVLERIVEEITAADERRHNIAHLSEFVSLDEMIEKAEQNCPEGTPIPSRSLVRLQFSPRNPYTHSALNFTSKIKVQYKIQRRQLRSAHPDDHYCAAQMKYLKERAIQMKEHTCLLFCDDKAKVPFGEPGSAVSTGVRGRMSIVPTTTTLGALDHDMQSKASLVPSVTLECDVPNAVDKSFVQGQVHTVINDAVFQTASGFRHAAVTVRLMKEKQQPPPVMMKFTDGGTDQRNNLELVKCASICIFKELDLDMYILARCAPGHSWINPAERIMSILNLGLQNVSLERQETSAANITKKLKDCQSMNAIREEAKKTPDIKREWEESVATVKSIIEGRFARLKLKDQPIRVDSPVSEEDIDILMRHLREMFPDLDTTKLQKTHTRKCVSYNKWKEEHCRERQYTFQIRKCKDPECCLPPRLPSEMLMWLPDPVLAEGGEHFKKYDEVRRIMLKTYED